MNLREIVEYEVGTYRFGAPITVYDIRVGAEADGIDISGHTNREIAQHLARICEAAVGPYGIKDRRSYYRRATA